MNNLQIILEINLKGVATSRTHEYIHMHRQLTTTFKDLTGLEAVREVMIPFGDSVTMSPFIVV